MPRSIAIPLKASSPWYLIEWSSAASTRRPISGFRAMPQLPQNSWTCELSWPHREHFMSSRCLLHYLPRESREPLSPLCLTPAVPNPHKTSSRQAPLLESEDTAVAYQLIVRLRHAGYIRIPGSVPKCTCTSWENWRKKHIAWSLLSLSRKSKSIYTFGILWTWEQHHETWLCWYRLPALWTPFPIDQSAIWNRQRISAGRFVLVILR